MQLFEKYGTLIETNTALIEKVPPCRTKGGADLLQALKSSRSILVLDLSFNLVGKYVLRSLKECCDSNRKAQRLATMGGPAASAAALDFERQTAPIASPVSGGQIEQHDPALWTACQEDSRIASTRRTLLQPLAVVQDRRHVDLAVK